MKPRSSLLRVTGIAVLIAASIGLLACAAGIACTWLVGSRLEQANRRVFDLVRTSLTAVEDRVARLQKRTQQSRVVADELRSSIEDWAKKETAEYLATRLKVADKAHRLSTGIEQADLLLEMSEEILQRVGRTAELADTLGARLDPESINQSLAKLKTVREKVNDLSQAVGEIRTRVDKLSEEDRRAPVRSELLKLAARAVAVLTDIDKVLEEIRLRLSEARTKLGNLEAKTGRYIAFAEFGLTALIALMFVGQCLLLRSGLNQLIGKPSRGNEAKQS